MKPPYAIGSVPSLSGHAIAYRWRSLPRVRRHRASKPQGSSERVLPWQIPMDQLIFASLSHTHYWYEVGMLKVPARGGFSFLAVTTLAEAVKLKHGGKFSAVMLYSGSFSAVGGFSLFGGNGFGGGGKTKIWRDNFGGNAIQR